jgi:hypothetical protein
VNLHIQNKKSGDNYTISADTLAELEILLIRNFPFLQGTSPIGNLASKVIQLDRTEGYSVNAREIPALYGQILALQGPQPEIPPKADGTFSDPNGSLSPLQLNENELRFAGNLNETLAKYDHREIEELYDLCSLDDFKEHIGNEPFLDTKPVPPPKGFIVPYLADGQKVAKIIESAFYKNLVHHINLNGKHSSGTLVAKDPLTKDKYLIKPGSGDLSPAKGVDDYDYSQSKREAVFWHIASAVGLGEFYPKCEAIYIEDVLAAVFKMLPDYYQNFGDFVKDNKHLTREVLTPYLVSGDLHKWAILDYVLGNTDRHSQNIMIDTHDNKTLKLIDHGSALAGENFDPAFDSKSYIPFYLRAFSAQRKFHPLSPEERYQKMPRCGRAGEKTLDKWLRGINTSELEGVFTSYNVEPRVFLTRLRKLVLSDAPKDALINAIFAGLE